MYSVKQTWILKFQFDFIRKTEKKSSQIDISLFRKIRRVGAYRDDPTDDLLTYLIYFNYILNASGFGVQVSPQISRRIC